jgi:hypothetical protein
MVVLLEKDADFLRLLAVSEEGKDGRDNGEGCERRGGDSRDLGGEVARREGRLRRLQGTRN